MSLNFSYFFTWPRIELYYLKYPCIPAFLFFKIVSFTKCSPSLHLLHTSDCVIIITICWLAVAIAQLVKTACMADRYLPQRWLVRYGFMIDRANDASQTIPLLTLFVLPCRWGGDSPAPVFPVLCATKSLWKGCVIPTFKLHLAADAMFMQPFARICSSVKVDKYCSYLPDFCSDFFNYEEEESEHLTIYFFSQWKITFLSM